MVQMKKPARLLSLALITHLIAACQGPPPVSTGQAAQTPSQDYQATVRWTRYGIPHVRAEDWGSLGYGFGYAKTRDVVCTFANEVIVARGEASRYFGPDAGRRESDIFHKATLGAEALAHAKQRVPAQMRALADGYVAGYNRYLADVTPAGLPAACRNQPWVRPIERDDLERLGIRASLGQGIGRLPAAIALAAPPEAQQGRAPGASTAALAWTALGGDAEAGGSNAIALGKAATANGRGLLLGNPHYPWLGPNRFHIAHLTIPGTLDVMGVGLLTRPNLSIGFTADVAWTHTVSTAQHATVYRLELVEGDPLSYRYGDSIRRIERRAVEIEVRKTDGSIERESHAVYDSAFGPVIELPQLPWSKQWAYAIRDANLRNNRSAEQVLGFYQAKSVEDVLAALRSTQGTAFVNTLAADKRGQTLYADFSLIPNVERDLVERCRAMEIPGAPIYVLRGAPECEWSIDPRAQQPGTLAPERLPHVLRDDYVTNSNDSYWLSSPRQPLEGFSPIIGPEGTPRSLRTRAGIAFVEEVLSSGGRFTPERLRELMYSQRNYGAELLLDDVLKACADTRDVAPELAQACATLASWDRRHTVTSRGAHLWQQLLLRARGPEIWAVPFDRSDPARTPRGLKTSDPTARQRLLGALSDAAKALRDKRISLDAAWGDLQYVERGGTRIGIPGGGEPGMFSIISAGPQPGPTYTPITYGNSWIQVVSWTDAGTVEAQGILTYSQSEDPDSAHSVDQTRLYSEGKWIELPFAEAAIAAEPDLETLELRSAR
jgi:acyl-homoserine-lactone acylase